MAKKLFVTTLALLLLLGGAAWGLRNFAVSRALEVVRSGAAAKGLVFEFGEKRLNFFTISLTNVRVDGVMNRAPVSLRVEEISLSPLWSAILSGKPGVNVAAKLYRGEFHATADASWDGRSLAVSANAERIELSEHPMLRAVGIDRGQLSFNIPSFVQEPSGTVGTFSLELIRLGKQSPTEIPGTAVGKITIPAFERISLNLKGGVRDRTLVLRPADLESDFGTASGTLSLDEDRSSGSENFPSNLIPQGRASSETAIQPSNTTQAGFRGQTSVNGRAQVSLTESGQHLLGAWLPVFSNGEVPAETTRLEVHLSGPISHPTLKMIPLR